MKIFDYQTTVEIDRELRSENDAQLAIIARVDCPADTSWGQLSSDERRGLRARNELARRARLAAADQAKAADAAAAETRRAAAAAAAVATFEQQARAVFPGSAAEFQAAWPQIKQRWQIEQAMQSRDLIAEKRASDIYTRRLD